MPVRPSSWKQARGTALVSANQVGGQARGITGNGAVGAPFLGCPQAGSHVQLAGEGAVLVAPGEADAQAAGDAGPHDPVALTVPVRRQLPRGAQLQPEAQVRLPCGRERGRRMLPQLPRALQLQQCS